MGVRVFKLIILGGNSLLIHKEDTYDKNSSHSKSMVPSIASPHSQSNKKSVKISSLKRALHTILADKHVVDEVAENSNEDNLSRNSSKHLILNNSSQPKIKVEAEESKKIIPKDRY